MSTPLQPIRCLKDLVCPHCKGELFVSVGILGPKIEYVTTRQDLENCKQRVLAAIDASAATDEQKVEMKAAASKEDYVVTPSEVASIIDAITQQFGAKVGVDESPKRNKFLPL